MATDSFQEIFRDAEIVIHSVSKKIKHVLTHQHIYAKFYLIEIVDSDLFLTESFLRVNEKDISLYPISRLIHRYLES